MSLVGTELPRRERAGLLCPDSSDVNLLGYGTSVIDLNAKIPCRAFDFFIPNKSCTARRLPVCR
jgi:hypothetical protein